MSIFSSTTLSYDAIGILWLVIGSLDGIKPPLCPPLPRVWHPYHLTNFSINPWILTYVNFFSMIYLKHTELFLRVIAMPINNFLTQVKWLQLESHSAENKFSSELHLQSKLTCLQVTDHCKPWCPECFQLFTMILWVSLRPLKHNPELRTGGKCPCPASLLLSKVAPPMKSEPWELQCPLKNYGIVSNDFQGIFKGSTGVFEMVCLLLPEIQCLKVRLSRY